MRNIATVDDMYNDKTMNVVFDTLKKDKQALVFVNTRRSAEKTAEEISKKIKEKSCEDIAQLILKALVTPTKQCKRLADSVKKGIAFHHSGLVAKQREVIEENFKSGRIKIIACTPTLAAGVDLPAFRTIIRDLKRYGGSWGMQNISVMEYHQMAGRAGRPSYDNHGEAITIAKSESEKDEIIEKFIFADAEDITSKLAVEPVLRTYLLSLIAAKFVNTKKEIMEFFGKTFWAHQFKDMTRIESIIERMLELLEEWEFIMCSSNKENKDKKTDDDFTSAYDMQKDKDDDKYKATQLGKRVAELYIDPYTAYNIVECLRRGSSMNVDVFSFLNMICNTIEIKPLLRVKTKEWDDIQEQIARYEDKMLSREPSLYEPEYEEFMNAFKTTMFMMEWVNERDEEYLLEKYDIRPGEIRYKLEIGDWLLYSSIEMAKILGFRELVRELSKARIRLKNGVKEELLLLLKLKQVGRVRARKLFNNGIKDIAGVKRAELGKLMLILGKETAIKVKEQVGEEVPVEVSKRKRKGQMSIEKYDTVKKK